MNDIYQKIVFAMKEVSDMRGNTLISDLNADTVLLDSGLDSLGFAILVAKLEEEFGYDPFLSMTTPVYPKTLGEFVEVYNNHEKK
jgi:acyl carrier protein